MLEISNLLSFVQIVLNWPTLPVSGSIGGKMGWPYYARNRHVKCESIDKLFSSSLLCHNCDSVSAGLFDAAQIKVVGDHHDLGYNR